MPNSEMEKPAEVSNYFIPHLIAYFLRQKNSNNNFFFKRLHYSEAPVETTRYHWDTSKKFKKFKSVKKLNMNSSKLVEHAYFIIHLNLNCHANFFFANKKSSNSSSISILKAYISHQDFMQKKNLINVKMFKLNLSIGAWFT